ncbi:hypothetical protein [Ekhidna sp.]|uniref:hypothetical protein n=1 Tax=Ekhidna sp. TaxID=2608089 RepID=UPI003299E5E8
MIWLFSQILDHRSSRIIQVLTSCFIVGTVISFFYFQITEANTFLSLSSDLSYILLSLIVYLQLLKYPSQKLTTHPVFWIATSFFVHSSLILLQSVFDNYLIFDQKISSNAYQIIYGINLLANISKNFILFYSLMLISKGYPAKIPTSVT